MTDILRDYVIQNNNKKTSIPNTGLIFYEIYYVMPAGLGFKTKDNKNSLKHISKIVPKHSSTAK